MIAVQVREAGQWRTKSLHVTEQDAKRAVADAIVDVLRATRSQYPDDDGLPF